MNTSSAIPYQPVALPDVTKIDIHPSSTCKHKARDDRGFFCGSKSKLVAGVFSTILLILLFVNSVELDGSEQSHSHLLKRQNSFTQHGYHWIVIGIAIALFILIVFGLTWWCCRGAFQNPLCCPCYTLACCGAVQCAECCCLGTIAADQAAY